MTDQGENRQVFSGGNEEHDFQRLRRLVVAAPPSTLSRFRKRANILQGTRMLFESQIHGFWIVLDIVLKRLFRAAHRPPSHYPTRPDMGERA
jgi:hypothetical protein